MSEIGIASNSMDISEQRRRLLEYLLDEEDDFGSSEEDTISRREDRTEAPLSFAQQRLWLLDQLEPGNPAYNIPFAIRLTGALDFEALERSLNEIIRRHEVLRTSFVVRHAQPVQVIEADARLTLEVTDLRGLEASARAADLERIIKEEALERFDLGRGPLIRARLVRESGREQVLLLTIHHIAGDGWSIGVFVQELGRLYEAYSKGEESPLEELQIQYGDYAFWQRTRQGEELERQLEYWKKELHGAPTVLDLPTDRPRPALRSYRGATQTIRLSRSLSEALKQECRREGATMFMLLLAGFNALLMRYSGQEDILVGTPIANRTRAEIEGLIGYFANTLVIRTDLTGDPSFRELVRRVKDSTLGAYDHQDVPFETIVRELAVERDES
ncbi:MAG TPA: condensation domain-containing protein, partial [Blastocatellia bacterium]|nr:condensation domain-containing protein [Blastocatellia bacterium]